MTHPIMAVLTMAGFLFLATFASGGGGIGGGGAILPIVLKLSFRLFNGGGEAAETKISMKSRPEFAGVCFSYDVIAP